MIKRFILTAIALALAGCVPTTPVRQHPDCPAVQQAERQNAKDLQAYCFSEQTQDSLKCEQAKLQAARLTDVRNRMGKDSFFYPHAAGNLGPGRHSYSCAPTL